MHRVAAPAVGVIVVALGVALAPTAEAQEYRYVEAGSAHEYAIVTAPLPAWEFGAAAVRAAARARGAAPDAAAMAAMAAAAPPALSWQAASLAPFGPATDKPKCPTVVGDPARERVAVLHLRRRFRVGRELPRLKTLRLRVRYRDGFVARVNGVEVARRNLDPSAAPLAPAQRSHGPEWEAIWIEVRPGLLREGDNELALEVRPGPQRLAPTVDVELTAGAQAHIVRGPMVQRVGVDRAIVVFETDLLTYAELWYGTAPGDYDRYVRSPAGRATHHVIELVGLEPDSAVHYQVVMPKERTGDLSFHTAPRPGEVVRFVVYGDVRSGHDVHARIVEAVQAEAPDFIVTTGDMVLRGSDAGDWQRFFAITGPLLARIPVYPAIGNHDLGAHGDEKRTLEDMFELPPGDRPEGATWYGFDVGDVHFAVLDSNHWGDHRQLAWLEEDLRAARDRGARAIFAACHHGPWSRGPHGGDATAAREYAPVLERYGVLVVFSGHDHLYQRGQVGKLRYVVTGGGGASLYKPRCGVAGRPRCREADGMQAIASEHHFVAVEVYRDHVRMCPKRPDGTLLEECVTIPISRARQEPARSD